MLNPFKTNPLAAVIASIVSNGTQAAPDNAPELEAPVSPELRKDDVVWVLRNGDWFAGQVVKPSHTEWYSDGTHKEGVLVNVAIGHVWNDLYGCFVPRTRKLLIERHNLAAYTAEAVQA